VAGSFVVFLFAALLGLATPTAFAHNVLIDSTPGDGDTVETAPTSIELVFDQPVQNKFPQVAVIDADENHYEQGEPEIVGSTVTQALDGLPDGEHTVSYRVLSADGHPVDGTISFLVGAGGADSSSTESVAEQESSAGPSAGLLIGIGAAVLTALVLAVLMAGKRRQPKRGAHS
jgi:hypothetical protein